VIFRHSVFPKRLSADALTAKAVLYTVSLGLDEIHERLTVEGYAWALAHFPYVLPILGDGFLIETSLRIQGIPGPEAAEQGRRMAGGMKTMLNGVKRGSSFAAVSELTHDSTFQAKLREAIRASQTDKNFLSAILRDASKYIQRLARRSRLGVSPVKARKLAQDYIIFEVAVYAHLAERGYLVDVYVGEELWILRQFLYGRLSGFPELTRRMIVSLKPEG
jgi:hypothetical protein